MNYIDECEIHNIELNSKAITKASQNLVTPNEIKCKKISHGLLMNLAELTVYDPVFEKGIMLDISRGRVYTISEIKKLIVELACQGIDYIELYMEDLVPLPQYPMYGYLRGGYTKEELSTLVEYAKIFDIEIIACVQALGHLENYLRWEEAVEIKDSSEVINVNKNQTYIFLNHLFETVKEIFGNEKIHIGMDEAFSMGLGKSFRESGTINQKKMFMSHLNKIEELCQKNGFTEIQIWSDMIFSVNTGTDSTGLYDPNFEVKELISSKFKLFYWNYWSRDGEVYQKLLNKHYELSNNVGLAIGVHIWSELFYNSQLFDASKVAIESARENEIDNVMLTLWNDDGGICNWESAKFGIFQTLSEVNQIENKELLFQKIYSQDYNKMTVVSNFALNSCEVTNLFWDDPIIQLYRRTLSVDVINRALMELDSKILLEEEANYQVYQTYNSLIKYLTVKLSNSLSTNVELEQQKEEVALFKQLMVLIENDWLSNSKIEGYEIIQSRMLYKRGRYDFLISNFNDPQITNFGNDNRKVNYSIVDRHYPKVAYVNTNKM